MEQIFIQIPEGHEIDLEKSNLAKGRIVFKKKEVTPWRFTKPEVKGFYMTSVDSTIRELNHPSPWIGGNENVFATEKQVRSMRAMAQLSQIIENDKRFGGAITDEEWLDRNECKYVIDRVNNRICINYFERCAFRFLAFHTSEQRDLFLKENEDLIRQYYMLD